MTATLNQLDELERSNLASFWLGVRAGVRMSTALDAGRTAATRLAELIGPGVAVELAEAVTEILLRAEPQPQRPKPPAEPHPPVLVPPQARPGGRPRR